VYRPNWQAARGNPETLAKIQMLAMVESVKKMQIDGGGNDGVCGRMKRAGNSTCKTLVHILKAMGRRTALSTTGTTMTSFSLIAKGQQQW
jgi:hypothetical protein